VKNCGVKVVLGGQGGDELFGGYPPYYALAIKNILKHISTPEMFPPFSEICRLPLYGHRYGIFQRFFKRSRNKAPSLFVYNQNDIDAINRTRSESLAHISDLDPYEFQAYQHIKYYLPTLLHVEDRTSMACSIESRVPLLDYRLVELAAKMPSWMKVRKGTLKYILREAMRGKVPDEILDRRDKKGFPTPISQWFSGDISGWVRKTLVQEELMSSEFVNPSAVAAAVEDHIAGRADNGHLIWSVLNLELWMRGIKSGWRDVQ
jgi:asparagine synthase (glutamine-hydrolysing)